MTNREETRKEISGYEWKYEVSSLGRIRSLYYRRWIRKFPLIIKPWYNKRWWYLAVSLYINWKNTTKRLNRLVAQTFLPNPENKPHVNHKNSIRTDNRIDNLEWVTVSENAIHGFKYWKRKWNWLRFWKWKFGENHNRSNLYLLKKQIWINAKWPKQSSKNVKPSEEKK